MEALPIPTTPLLPSPVTPAHLHDLILRANSLSPLKQIHTHLLKSPLLLTLQPLFLTKLLSLSAVDYAASAFLHSPVPGLSNRILRHLSRMPDGNHRKTLLFYARMRNHHAISVDRFSFPPVLRGAARAAGKVLGSEEVGRDVHGVAVKMGLESDPFVETGLVGFYAALGCIGDARGVFDRMPYRDLVAWSVMMDGYCQTGRYNEALHLFEEMKSSGVTPDPVILATVLTACSRTGNLQFGQVIHSYISDTNISVDAHLQTALLTMYSNCGSMQTAQKLYDPLLPKNPAASTAMVFGYAKLGQIELARAVFDSMADKDLVAWIAEDNLLLPQGSTLYHNFSS